MFTINPLYAAIAGGVLALGMAGTIKYQNDQIHKYHTQFNCAEYGSQCEKNTDIIRVPDLQAEIRHMADVQVHQTTNTQKNIPAVKPTPEVITKIKEIKVPAKVAEDCPTPEIPEDLKDLLP